jgi:tetratricopeptide (TPR) repeat protein
MPGSGKVVLILAAAVLLGMPAARGKAVADGDLEAGHRAYEQSDYRRAVEILQQAAVKNPRDGEVQLLLAKSHFELREYDAAIAHAEKAVQTEPQNSVYHEWLGRSYGEKASKSSWLSALSLAKKTQQELETAVRLDQRNFAAFQALIEFDCAAPGIAGGGEDKARPKIEQLAALDASEGHYAAGNCRRQKKDFPAADLEFDRALVGARSADLIFDIGDYAARRNQPERLAAVAEVGRHVAPSDPRVGFYRAAALILKKENPQEAEKLLREYLRTAPTRTAYPRPSAVHNWLGQLLETQNNRSAAEREYETSLQLDPKNKMAQEALTRLRKS